MGLKIIKPTRPKSLFKDDDEEEEEIEAELIPSKPSNSVPPKRTSNTFEITLSWPTQSQSTFMTDQGVGTSQVTSSQTPPSPLPIQTLLPSDYIFPPSFRWETSLLINAQGCPEL